jgi:acetyl-CoA carboxylase beta subunit
MSARESRTTRPEQRQENEEASAGRDLPRRWPRNALDRCDRCGAQAYVRVLFQGRRELLFCAHHYRQHARALARLAVHIQDDTGRLVRCEWLGSRG